jgi:hypothetical protein
VGWKCACLYRHGSDSTHISTLLCTQCAQL